MHTTEGEEGAGTSGCKLGVHMTRGEERVGTSGYKGVHMTRGASVDTGYTFVW